MNPSMYYRVTIMRAVEFGTYYVRAASFAEAHDKALAAAEVDAKKVGQPRMPVVQLIERFCPLGAVLD